ncbi:MAG: hypothetical protein Kow0092_26240 [Deferrisomatales bacterium]
MCRKTVVWGGALLLAGCAAGPQSRAPDLEARIDELANAQARLELRMEEVSRNVLALRRRLDAREEALREEPSPSDRTAPRTVRVVDLAPAPVASAPAARQETGPAHARAADLYRSAYSAYREGRFGEAILDFEEFLRAYPEHEYADNAQYWIGESYYSQGQFEQAIVEFSRVIDRYPERAKAPDALFKIGRSYEQLGDRKKAEVFWNRLLAQYPRSEAAGKARGLLDGRSGAAQGG